MNEDPLTTNSSMRLSAIDTLITHVDRAIRTLHMGTTRAHRESPAEPVTKADTLNHRERRHAAGLMRVNHTGEVCAQALYSGQSLTAKSPEVRESMLESALEEEDHLAWCEKRLLELDSRTSLLNPIFYAGSFAMGAIAGLLGDKTSLGFIAATEDRVCEHLRSHLHKLPKRDKRSRLIVEKMIEDETKHGEKAIAAGGKAFSEAQKNAMASLATLMTKTTYRI